MQSGLQPLISSTVTENNNEESDFPAAMHTILKFAHRDFFYLKGSTVSVGKIICAIFLIGYCGGALAASEEKAMLVSEPVYECQNPDYQSFLQKNYVLFEVGQVHPLERSADGLWLFALNSPLGCLEIYRVENNRLQLASSVAVGIQPVSVRVRNSHEVWVVNHLSDNVSVIELSGRPRIKKILQVGDAPFDVAFAAKDSNGQATRAYISCSARGQHHPTFELHNLISNIVEYQENGKIKKDKLGMADLWVYDIRSDVNFEGIINPFMADLRSLAVSDDGKTVYGAGFLSGNQSTSILASTSDTVSDENLTSIATAKIVKKQQCHLLHALFLNFQLLYDF